MAPHDVSFVYFNILLNGMASILLIFFFIYAYNERSKIYGRHDTISSFCAERNSWGSRFLLSFTCIVGVNMLCLHVEEYNSRSYETNGWFWVEIAVILPLPLVGMCYTKGKRYDERDLVAEEILIKKPSNKALKAGGVAMRRQPATVLSYDYEEENEVMDCGFVMFPIVWSERIHDLAAGVFFCGLTLTNIVYTTGLVMDPDRLTERPLTVVSLFIASSVNVVVLIIFVAINKVYMGICRKTDRVLRTWSFVLECVLGAVVIIVATLNSVKRNEHVDWLK
eukprot:690118_1